MAYRGPLQQDVDMQWRENAELRRLESGAPGSTELCVECDSDDVGVGTNRGSALPSESDGLARYNVPCGGLALWRLSKAKI